MSDPLSKVADLCLASALPNAHSEGFCDVSEAGLVGMITLRADLSLGKVGSVAKVAKAVQAAIGAKLPASGMVTSGQAGRVAWMSPDEILLMVDHGKAVEIERKISASLVESHVLVANVSDARAVFHVTGKAARDVIAKLSPTDLRGFGPGMFRRTRFAQVPAAFHMPEPDMVEVVCFRSVAQYMFDLLTNAARHGTEIS